MGGLGYQSDAQASLAVSFNDLRGYALALNRALSEPYPAYEAIGLRDGENYRQLATTLLQIENEFYGTIRPKCTSAPGERPLHALGHRGHRVRRGALPRREPVPPGRHRRGLDAPARHLPAALPACRKPAGLAPRRSPPMARNQQARRRSRPRAGRAPGPVRASRWRRPIGGRGCSRQCEPIAASLDEAHGGDALRRGAFGRRNAALARPVHAALGPRAARDRRGARHVLPRVRAREVAAASRNSSTGRSAAEAAARIPGWPSDSLAEQREIEAADDIPFEDYRRRYLGQDLMSGPHFRSP